MGDGDGTGPIVLALDFGGTKIAAAVAELDGTRIGTRVTPTAPELGAGENLSRALACARHLLDAEGRGRPLAAVSAATFGLPTPEGVRLAPNIPGWDRLRLADALREAFGSCPLRVGNDVKAATAAEARAGALVGCDPGLYLNLGTGLAVGIVCGGTVIAGAHGAAGEVGYNLRELADLDTGTERVVLEDVVSGMALAAAGTREAGTDLSAADVFADGQANGALAAALDSFFRELSFHLVNLSVALDPARVAVGGGMVRSWERIEPRLRASLEAFVPYPPELVRAAFPYDASLVGAIAWAVEAAAEATTEAGAANAGDAPSANGALPAGAQDKGAQDKDWREGEQVPGTREVPAR